MSFFAKKKIDFVKVSKVKFYPFKQPDNIEGYCSFVLNDIMLCRVKMPSKFHLNEEGVVYPALQLHSGARLCYFKPVSNSVQLEIDRQIREAYKRAVPVSGKKYWVDKAELDSRGLEDL